MAIVGVTMEDPGWTMERTAQELLSKLDQAQVTAGAMAGKTSFYKLLRLRPRTEMLANFLRRTTYPYLRVGFINFGISFLVGSMLSISLYVLLFLAGSEKVEARDRYQQWIQAYGTGVGQSRVRLHKGWEGRHSTQSLDSELQLSCENDLEGRTPSISPLATWLADPSADPSADPLADTVEREARWRDWHG